MEDNKACEIIAEIGINHNGNLDLALEMMLSAKSCGCNYVKFQKREPEICVPKSHWHKKRQTPWGELDYIDYKKRIEFDQDAFDAIDDYAKEIDMPWFASCWDMPSVSFIANYEVPIIKAASASITDHGLLLAMKATGIPVMISTGMSTMAEIDQAVQTIGSEALMIAHSTSIYPCPPEKLNLQMIQVLKERYSKAHIGYSGHEQGIVPSFAAAIKGAKFIERHFTIDKNMWGTDQSSSLEPDEMRQMIEMIRQFEMANGDGKKVVYPEEQLVLSKLRKTQGINSKV